MGMGNATLSGRKQPLSNVHIPGRSDDLTGKSVCATKLTEVSDVHTLDATYLKVQTISSSCSSQVSASVRPESKKKQMIQMAGSISRSPF
jgi:hypothetical protein